MSRFPKALFLHIIFSISLLHCSAQFIFHSKKPINTNLESIDKYEKCYLKDSIPYSKIIIIDSRYDTLDIGIHLDGFLVMKDNSVLDGLQHTMNKYYGPLCLPAKDTLLIQLVKLNIQEAVIRDTGFVYTIGQIKARLFRGANNAYTYVGAVDTVIQEKYLPEITYSAHKNDKHFNLEFWDYYLLRLYEAAIRKAMVADSLQHELAQPLTVEEIKKSGIGKRDKPILNADSLRPGFYRNFQEFENNSPTFLYVNGEALKNLLEVMNYRVGKKISDGEPDTTYWGFCTGKTIYVRYGYNFFQLERRDGIYYVAPTLDVRRQNINHSGLNLLLGLATLSASIAAKSGPEFRGFSMIPEPEMPLIILTENNSHLVGLQIDWDTGMISF